MKELLFPALACGLIITALGISACSKGHDANDAGAGTYVVHITDTSYCAVDKTGKHVAQHTDLISLKEADPSATPGALYKVSYGELATSYPPQTKAESWEKIADSAGSFKADMQLAPKAQQHLNDAVQVVDVRTPQEFAQGHLPGSINVPLQELDQTMAQALPDKKKLIMVYCRSGQRSGQAARMLVDAGYVLVFDLGGINSYRGQLAH